MAHRLGESRLGVDLPADPYQLIGDRPWVSHKPLEPGSDPFGARIIGGGLGEGADAVHHFGRCHGPTRGVEHQAQHSLRVGGGELDGDPAPQGLAVEVGLLNPEMIEQAEQMPDVMG